MKTVNFKQGSPEWHAHRANHFNASDAPAMMGVSSYKTRNQLLHERKTGITTEVDAATQRRFDAGHRFEALARERIAENIINDELYPCVGVEWKLSASFDGLTMDGSIAFEHKTLNAKLKACTKSEDLHEEYHIQMQQQLIVSGASKCLFIASKWDDDDNLIDSVKFWYESKPNLAQAIKDGWAQFEKDLAEYVPAIAAVEAVIVEPVMGLPMVSVQVAGELTASNLKDVTPIFDEFLSNSITKLETDEDFAKAEAQAKVARAAAKQCLAVNEQVIGQMLSVSEVTRIMTHYAERLNASALLQEKAVKEQKEFKKTIAKSERDALYAAHIAALNAELSPVSIELSSTDKPDFVSAMKNQRMLESVFNKLDTELARAKIAADAVARKVRANLSYLNENASEYRFLFNDLQQIAQKDEADFSALIKVRVSTHEEAQAAKLEAERAQMQREEQAKAERAAQAAKVEAERVAQAAKAEEERVAQEKLAVPQAQPDPIAVPQRLIMPLLTTESQAQIGEATLTIGLISERLGFTINAEFLSRIGFEPQQVGKYKKYHESSFESICGAIIRHVSDVAFGLNAA